MISDRKAKRWGKKRGREREREKKRERGKEGERELPPTNSLTKGQQQVQVRPKPGTRNPILTPIMNDKGPVTLGHLLFLSRHMKQEAMSKPKWVRVRPGL